MKQRTFVGFTLTVSGWYPLCREYTLVSIRWSRVGDINHETDISFREFNMSSGQDVKQDLSAEAIVALTGVPSGFSLNRGSFDLGDEANDLDREAFSRGGASYFSSEAPTNVARETARETTKIMLARAGLGLKRKLLVASAASSAALGAAAMFFVI